jgi:hypothetical protein
VFGGVQLSDQKPEKPKPLAREPGRKKWEKPALIVLQHDAARGGGSILSFDLTFYS